ncbi:hypothetical protein R6Q59_024285 [Mikania micrantha]
MSRGSGNEGKRASGLSAVDRAKKMKILTLGEVYYIESSDSSESLLSGPPAFVPASETLGFAARAGAVFFLAIRALSSPTSSGSPISVCRNVCQETYKPRIS